MNILFIAVHPDDETLGCGGTILKHSDNKDSIHWLIITEGKKDQGFSDLQINNSIIQVESVKKAYNFNSVHKLGLPASALHMVDFNEIISGISRVIYEIKPEIVYMNNRYDIHTDHQIAAKAIFSCTKGFRYSFIKKLLMYECISETEAAPPLPENVFAPNIYSDITDYIDRKIEIMKLFKTEIQEAPMPRSEENIRALARYRGSCCCINYAEAFMLLREVI